MNATFLATRWWMSLIACLLLPAGAAVAQSLVRSFEGDAGPGLEACKAGVNHCGRQPEMNAAGNGAHVLQVTWQSVRVHDYDGKLLRSTPFADFARAAGLDPIVGKNGRGPFEPHVVFNEFIQRWIITSTCKNDCFIVSSSPDPLGSWKGVNVTCLQGGPCLEFNPGLKLGYDRNGVYYCGGHQGDENPNTVIKAGYDCFAIPSAEVEAIGRGVEPKHINRVHNMPLDIVPAIDNNPAKKPTDPALFMNKSCGKSAPSACQRSATNYAFNWIVNSFTWNGPTGTWNWGGAQQLVKTDIGSKADKWVYNTPCCGEDFSIPQAGTDVTIRAAGSHRVLNVVQVGSHLHGVLGSGPCKSDCGTQGTDTNNLMIYVDLDCSNPKACVVHDTAKISGADFNPEFGTVGVDTQGNIGILATSSTASTHLSILGWSRKAGEKTFSGPTTLVKGTQPHTCMPDKKMVPIGSTVGIPTVRDTKDGLKLWTSLQWSNDAAPCVFNTRIIQYQLADAADPPLLYTLDKTAVLPSTNSGWDYIKMEPRSSRLFMARDKDGLTVFDIDTNKAITTVGNSVGANGPLLLPEYNRGYVAMTDGSLLSFDLKSLKPIERLPLASDGGLNSGAYDPATRQIHFITSVRPAESTWFTLDAATGKLLKKTVFPFKKMDDPANDGKGTLFAPARRDNLILKLDSRTLEEQGRWTVECNTAKVRYQAHTNRVLVACSGENPMFLAVDASNGKTVARIPIGKGMDGFVIDEQRHRIVTSNGIDGTLTVIGQKGADDYELLGTVSTRVIAKMMHLDERTGRLLLVAADYTMTLSKPDASGNAAKTYTLHPNTFTVLNYKPD